MLNYYFIVTVVQKLNILYTQKLPFFTNNQEPPQNFINFFQILRVASYDVAIKTEQ